MSTESEPRFLPLIAASLPKVLRSKPSWIGRPPLSRPDKSTMKQDVRLSYRSPGLRPPVYVVTSLSDPEWEPVELHSTVLENKELEFWREFKAEEGEYQYKFRLGPGDWWALDESKPIVDDGEGNRNNIINVQAPPAAPSSIGTAPTQQPIISPSQVDPINALQIHDADFADHDESKAQQVRLGPADPLTPPMTPEMSEKIAIDSGKFRPFPVPATQQPSSVPSSYSEKSLEEAQPGAQPSKDTFTVQDDGPKAETGVIARFKFFLISLGTWMISLFGGGMRATGILALAVGLAAVVYKVRDIRDATFPGIFSIFSNTFRRNGTDPSSMV